MSTLDNLRRLVGGIPGPNGVLGACRLESGNVDAFGIEAVTDVFRRAPLAGAATATVVKARGHLAIFSDTEAVIADLYGDAVGRLWRVGQSDPGLPEPAVSVAFDTDLRQARASIFVSAAEHPALDPAALDRLMALGLELVHDADPAHAAFRARAFAVRAFGNAERGCALFAIHALAPNPVRSLRLCFAAVRWNGALAQIVRDLARPHPVHVRIAS